MTLADKRATALAAYETAQQNGGNWEAVATMLADLIPKPKATAKAGPEWCEYTAAQHKGRGRLFHANMSAWFEFADGTMIRAPMRHRCNLSTPDWAGAARFAVRFYRLKLARELLDVTGGAWGNVCQCREETYAAECQVPEFVDAIDETRDVRPDLERLNAATSTLREGHAFMAGMDWPGP